MAIGIFVAYIVIALLILIGRITIALLKFVKQEWMVIGQTLFLSNDRHLLSRNIDAVRGCWLFVVIRRHQFFDDIHNIKGISRDYRKHLKSHRLDLLS